MPRPALTENLGTRTASTDTVQQQVSLGARTTPRFVVEIEGRDLSREGMSALVERIVIEETEDKAPIARILLENTEGTLNDNPLLTNRSSLLVSMGWADTKLVSRGRFIIHKPDFLFGYGGKDLVEVLAYGEVIRLAEQGEQRREWVNVRDSDIAQSIAEQYGWTADVEQTSPTHERVIQANENDAEFLRRLALRTGKQMFVRNGTLHFHRVRYDQLGL